MLSRIGSATIALGLIAAGASALAQERIEPALESQPIPETRKQPGADQGQRQPRQQETDTDRLVPTINAITTAIRDLIAQEDAQQTKRQEQRDIADLRAQQDMAFWAKAVSFATFATVLLTAVGIYLIWRTLVYTRRAAEAAAAGTGAAIDAAKEAQRTADAAIKANKLNREAFNTEQGARLDLTEIQAVSPLMWRKIDDGTIGELEVRIEVHNGGNTPALGAWIETRLFADQFHTPTKCREEIAASARNRRLTLGQTVLKNARFAEIHTLYIYESELEEYIKQTRRDIWIDECNLRVHLVGCVDYGLVFADERRRISFTFSVGTIQPGEIICPALGDVPAERLAFRRHPFVDDISMD